ncbi:hypothetical protein MBM_06161 [Drepanopeziza brunnea f. sp. 'multigermtubi' MB_m1]|uniref:Uncharacterized protein n=1 Tax=Marssonina brunnea f. sp. multigermtubi (strain MB_m1) TaxID=1072389 RepID=K1X4B9_MARBU|nr:uncharacterized protein MBM_06161 [Drepanopeziza brunnea f. sp. 'multigermtubi' MB_m1]EKD15533.1 hypothetical protein MBM_06161 [Drepanopeziza brunnea f. sp. 'multigermtubi' MB_m1]
MSTTYVPDTTTGQESLSLPEGEKKKRQASSTAAQAFAKYSIAFSDLPIPTKVPETRSIDNPRLETQADVSRPVRDAEICEWASGGREGRRNHATEDRASRAEARTTLSDYVNKAKRKSAQPPRPVSGDYRDRGTVETRSGKCPAAWASLVSEPSAMLIDRSVSSSHRNDDARAAIRVSRTLRRRTPLAELAEPLLFRGLRAIRHVFRGSTGRHPGSPGGGPGRPLPRRHDSARHRTCCVPVRARQESGGAPDGGPRSPAGLVGRTGEIDELRLRARRRRWRCGVFLFLFLGVIDRNLVDCMYRRAAQGDQSSVKREMEGMAINAMSRSGAVDVGRPGGIRVLISDVEVSLGIG